MAVTAQNYLDLLGATNVSDIPPATLLEFINEARIEIIESRNWPFRYQTQTVSSASTPITAGTISYVKNSQGYLIEPISEEEAASYASSTSASPAATYYLTNTGQSTYAHAIPSDTLTVVYLVAMTTLGSSDTETVIPDKYKMAVVYAAAVRAHTFVGVLDMAQQYSALAERAINNMVAGEMDQMISRPLVTWDVGP